MTQHSSMSDAASASALAKEGAPEPPNHRGAGFLTYPRQAAIAGQDWGSAFRVVPGGPTDHDPAYSFCIILCYCLDWLDVPLENTPKRVLRG